MFFALRHESFLLVSFFFFFLVKSKSSLRDLVEKIKNLFQTAQFTLNTLCVINCTLIPNKSPLYAVSQQAIRVLGLLGALDPYKHKVNIGMIDQSRDASAVSLSESKSSQDSGRPACLSVIPVPNHPLGNHPEL